MMNREGFEMKLQLPNLIYHPGGPEENGEKRQS